MSVPDRVIRHIQSVLTSDANPGSRYEIVDEVGRGGMGIVYRCRDLELGRDVALKVLATSGLDSGLADRLRQEASVLASLEHPSVIPIHDAGRMPDGRPFYVMKYVDGLRLGDWARQTPTTFDRLSVMIRVIEAVAYAHDRGILHRDLKPDNVMVGAFGAVFVLDWGLAKTLPKDAGCDPAIVATESQADERRTEHGTVLGTPAWMPPEQARGRSDEIDERSDVYGLGGLLYHLLTEKPPGQAFDATGRPQQITPPRRLVGSVAKPLDAICVKALAPNPKERYGSAKELLQDIRNYLAQEPVAAWPESQLARVIRIARKHRALLMLLGAYLLVRVGLFFWQTIRDR